MMEPWNVLDNEFVYIGEDEKYHIKDEAPDELKKEFNEFFSSLHTEENGMIIKHS